MNLFHNFLDFFNDFNIVVPYGFTIWLYHMARPYGFPKWQSHMAVPYDNRGLCFSCERKTSSGFLTPKNGMLNFRKHVKPTMEIRNDDKK